MTVPSSWPLGNGVSAYEAKEMIEGNFLLLMADHVFSPKILCELQKYKIDKDECALCVDTQMKYVFDINDATKVLVDNDRIVQIGKELKDYNGVDMGIFLCSPIIFEALNKSIQKGRYSLTEAVRELVDEEKMKACCFDDEDHYWIDIDTPRIGKIAEKILPFLEESNSSSKNPLRDKSLTKSMRDITVEDLSPICFNKRRR